MYGDNKEYPNPPTDDWGFLDSDGDGLTNQTELILGTDPYNLDSDGDGLLDSQELLGGSNPLVRDQDWGVDFNCSPFLCAKQVALTALADGFTISQIQDYLIELPELKDLGSEKAQKLADIAIKAAQYQNALNTLDSELKQSEQPQLTSEKTLRRSIS